MYEPQQFKIEDHETLIGVMRAHPLGVLVTAGAGGLMANPVPFIVVEEGERMLLRAHLARPNPQWRELEEGAAPLVIFQGEGHYISPSWYATKAETHKVVPTWNYVMVQVRGSARVDDSPEFLRPQIEALTAQHEGTRNAPWAMSDAPDAFIAAQMRGIVGIEIEIDDIKGKFKLSQNRNEADRAGVVAGLGQDGDPAALTMVQRMQSQP